MAALQFCYSGPEPAMAAISPLRALLLRESDPDRWATLWALMSHNSARGGTEYWSTRHAAVIKFIRETAGLVQFSAEDIDTVLGIQLVNDFEINARISESEWSSAEEGESVRGMYQVSSLCIALTARSECEAYYQSLRIKYYVGPKYE